VVHGGLLAALLDVAMASTAWTVTGPDRPFLTAGLRAEFPDPDPGLVEEFAALVCSGVDDHHVVAQHRGAAGAAGVVRDGPVLTTRAYTMPEDERELPEVRAAAAVGPASRGGLPRYHVAVHPRRDH
jgi:predicted DNA repair protein MutK